MPRHSFRDAARREKAEKGAVEERERRRVSTPLADGALFSAAAEKAPLQVDQLQLTKVLAEEQSIAAAFHAVPAGRLAVSLCRCSFLLLFPLASFLLSYESEVLVAYLFSS